MGGNREVQYGCCALYSVILIVQSGQRLVVSGSHGRQREVGRGAEGRGGEERGAGGGEDKVGRGGRR